MTKFISQFKKLFTSTSVIIFTLLLALQGIVPTALAQDSLLPDPCPPQGCPVVNGGNLGNATRQDLADIILVIANLLTYIIGALAVLFIVLGGFLLVIGKGEIGWKFIKNSLIGLVISILAYTVVYIIGSTAQGTYINF